MIADSVKFRGHGCFNKEWAGFDSIKPINVIIGRNNTGKSHLLDLVAALCEGLPKRGWHYQCQGVLDEDTLRGVFPENTSGGDLPGDPWMNHGKYFLDVRVTWETDKELNSMDISFPTDFKVSHPFGEGCKESRLRRIHTIVRKATPNLAGSVFRRLLADRDIRTESPENELRLLPDGTGATNIIRKYILSANPQFPREVIQTGLLKALNEIFGNDGQFTEIQVQLYDKGAGEGKTEGHWEVFLGEEKKGLIPLSSSGSGLKTVILLLLNLLVVPAIQNTAKSGFTFAFEELENNVHPALLRRLFQYLENYAVTEESPIFLTTHSSTALDYFGLSENAQIVHVTHNGETARATTVCAHFDHLGVISELGAKPSDLLQANGIIWVEGPSDCIYLNRWIDLLSDGQLREGRDYQCAFYGGSLLARTQFVSPEDAVSKFVNLLRVNPNIVVVCDGDQTAATGDGSEIKGRVRRISDEVGSIPCAHMWVTAAKEIENYLPGSVLSTVFNTDNVPDPGQYEMFFPSDNEAKKGTSFLEAYLQRKSVDKMDLAVEAVPHMTREAIEKRFDLAEEISSIIEKIRSWNS